MGGIYGFLLKRGKKFVEGRKGLPMRLFKNIPEIRFGVFEAIFADFYPSN